MCCCRTGGRCSAGRTLPAVLLGRGCCCCWLLLLLLRLMDCGPWEMVLNAARGGVSASLGCKVAPVSGPGCRAGAAAAPPAATAAASRACVAVCCSVTAGAPLPAPMLPMACRPSIPGLCARACLNAFTLYIIFLSGGGELQAASREGGGRGGKERRGQERSRGGEERRGRKKPGR